MHPNDNKWATPVSVGDFFSFWNPIFMGQKPKRIAYLFKRPKVDSKNKHRHMPT